MPTYTPGTATAKQSLTGTQLQAELDAIAAAHNTHATGDFPVDSVPVTAMINDQSVFTLNLGYDGSLAGAVAIDANQKYWSIPMACTVVSARLCCATEDHSAGTITVKLYNVTKAADVFSVVTITGAGYIGTGTITGSAIAANDVIALRAAITVGDSISGLTIQLLLKATHTA